MDQVTNGVAAGAAAGPALAALRAASLRCRCRRSAQPRRHAPAHLLLLLATAAVLAAPRPATASGLSLQAALRTTSAGSVRGAGHLGGVQHFALPLAGGSCPPAAMTGFAKCLALPGGGQAWRFIMVGVQGGWIFIPAFGNAGVRVLTSTAADRVECSLR